MYDCELNTYVYFNMELIHAQIKFFLYDMVFLWHRKLFINSTAYNFPIFWYKVVQNKNANNSKYVPN